MFPRANKEANLSKCLASGILQVTFQRQLQFGREIRLSAKNNRWPDCVCGCWICNYRLL